MSEIPTFDDAAADFRRFLTSRGLGESLVWVFREDLCIRSPLRALVRMPPHAASGDLARKVYDEGRARGLVSITAVAKLKDAVATTVWYPKRSDEEVQGWNRGLKLSINEPLPTAFAVPPVAWRVMEHLPWYRWYQAHGWFVGTREWAAAEQ